MKLRCLFSCLFVSLFSISQTPDVTWQETIGGSLSDELNTVLLTDDGGYFLGGTSESNISGEKADTSKGGKDYWVIKLDSLRNIEWQKTIGGGSTDELKQVVKSNDGGYLLGGYSESNISSDKTEDAIGSYDYWIVKIDSVGNIEWDKTIGGTDNDQLIDIVALSEYGYVLAGNSASNISGNKTEDSEGYQDFWIVMIDSIGVIEWQNTIGGDSTDALFSIERTLDNGFILGGDTESDISGSKESPLIGIWDYWMVKINESGEYEWDRSVGGDFQSGYARAIQMEDGGYVIGGTSNCNAFGLKSEPAYNISNWVLKFDEEGELIWENTIGGHGIDYLQDIKPTTDGGVIIVGYSNSDISVDKTENAAGDDFWVIKLNSDGIIEWENTIAGINGDYPTSISQLNENEFIIGGRSGSSSLLDKDDPSRGSSDYWLLKLGHCDYIDNSVTEHYLGEEVIELEANAGGLEYQWYQCFNFSREPMLGENDQSFSLSWGDAWDDYTVMISDGDCSTFSDCYYINATLEMEENELINALNVYPNPTTSELKVIYNENLKVDIFNTLGKIVLSINGADLSLSNLSEGTYILKIYDAESNLISVNQVVKI